MASGWDLRHLFMIFSQRQIFLLVLLIGTGAVCAEESHLKLKVETSLSFDNNMFRLPSGSNPLQAVGKPSGSEQIGITGLTLMLSTALSLQKLELALTLKDYRYQNFDYLNYMSYNYNAALRWSLTPSLYGNFSNERKETANSFSDYLGLKQSNLRTETSTRLDAVYEVDGPWRISAGVSHYSQNNQQALVAGGDYTTSSIEAGFGYVFGTGSSVTFTQKSAKGQYLNRVLLTNSTADTHFAQGISDMRFHWAMPNNSTAELYLSYFSQNHPNVPQRDFSGLNSGASLNWLLTGKSSITLAQSRELSAYAGPFTNYSQTDRLSFGTSWQMTSRTMLRLRQEWARISFLGQPTALSPSQRRDDTKDSSLSLYWQPDQRLNFSAALQNAARAANQTGLDYEARQISISAQYSY
jgi:exopolysaccharide biosynthesis operon protein EpsL